MKTFTFDFWKKGGSPMGGGGGTRGYVNALIEAGKIKNDTSNGIDSVSIKPYK